MSPYAALKSIQKQFPSSKIVTDDCDEYGGSYELTIKLSNAGVKVFNDFKDDEIKFYVKHKSSFIDAKLVNSGVSFFKDSFGELYQSPETAHDSLIDFIAYVESMSEEDLDAALSAQSDETFDSIQAALANSF